MGFDNTISKRVLKQLIDNAVTLIMKGEEPPGFLRMFKVPYAEFQAWLKSELKKYPRSVVRMEVSDLLTNIGNGNITPSEFRSGKFHLQVVPRFFKTHRICLFKNQTYPMDEKVYPTEYFLDEIKKYSMGSDYMKSGIDKIISDIDTRYLHTMTQMFGVDFNENPSNVCGSDVIVLYIPANWNTTLTVMSAIIVGRLNLWCASHGILFHIAYEDRKEEI